MTATMAIGIDIGGTRLRVARISEDGRVLEQHRRPTPAAEAEVLVDAIDEEVSALVAALGGPVPVGIGIAGLVTPEGVVRYGPNIGIRDLPLAARLEERLGTSVIVLNDASAAALGEQRAGAGRGCADLVLFTLGTGVGGGIVLGGELVVGRGFAGELGHLLVQRDGRRCPCGNLGCLEAYASGRAIAGLAAERLDREAGASSLRDVAQVDGAAVSRAAAEGDALAIAVLEEVGAWLGTGIGSIVNALDPGLVLLGGGAGAATAPVVLPKAREVMTSLLLGGDARTAPPLELAALGDDAGVVGAAFQAVEQAQRAASPGRAGDRPSQHASASDPSHSGASAPGEPAHTRPEERAP